VVPLKFLAQIEHLTLVSADRAFKRYRVPLLWNR